MNTWKGWLISVVFACCVFSSVLAEAKAEIDVIPVAQDDAPLRIKSLTETSSDALSQIIVQNYSNKTITAYRLGWALIVPSGCSLQAVDTRIGNAALDETTIASGKEAASGSYRLSQKDLQRLARDTKAGLLHVQVGIVEVHFSDGSRWEFKLSDSKVFDTALAESMSTHCSGGEAKPTASVCDSTSPLVAIAEGVSPNIYFVCTGVPINIYCQNEVGSCTMARCANGSECPRQQCAIVP